MLPWYIKATYSEITSVFYPKEDTRLAPNNQNNKKDPNNKKRYTGFISIVLWALVLTIVFNFLFDGRKTPGIMEVKYSDFRNAVEQGAVELVDMDSMVLTNISVLTLWNVPFVLLKKSFLIQYSRHVAL